MGGKKVTSYTKLHRVNYFIIFGNRSPSEVCQPCNIKSPLTERGLDKFNSPKLMKTRQEMYVYTLTLKRVRVKIVAVEKK
jgi:hypothetical protein